jgi:AbrB family looped-hinge helix DNA binding protein
MRITAKGQVTIPFDIRRKAGLLPGTEVAFEFDGASVRFLRAPSPGKAPRGGQVMRRLLGSATVKMTTEQIMAVTRG